MKFEEYENCERCPDLFRMRAQVVWGSGNPNADIMLVAEGPGKDEDMQGIPFVGASGQFLDQFLEQVNLVRSEVYITNTVLCRPTRPGQANEVVNRPPTKVEIENCKDRLVQEVYTVDPIIIVAVGDVAASALYGKKMGIKKNRGKLIDIKLRTPNGLTLTYAMIPIYHPSYLLRTHSEEDMYHTINDLERAKNLVSRYKTIVSQSTHATQ